ncbi:MAG TPA: hypothetical protein VG125_05030 [Pirellulales bacterium]|jgi:hypothetical protein|nr:hypothetical protein [Pirellulales bacterium]
MRVLPLAHEVRQIVRETFYDLGIDDDVVDDMNETILIDDGTYRGRSYQTEGYFAMWLVEAGLVQFYDDDGNMVCTVNLFNETEPQRMAA